MTLAPGLHGLGITARLCDAYDQLTWDALSLHESLMQQVPLRALVASLHLVEAHNFKLMALLQKKSRPLYDYVVKLQGLSFVTGLLEGEIDEEFLTKKRQQLDERHTELGTPYELKELFLRHYQRLPRHRPAAKSTLYLRVLDFKIENPATSWGQLARKFCGDPAQENALKAWAYGMKKKLAAIGIDVHLENPLARRRSKPPDVK